MKKKLIIDIVMFCVLILLMFYDFTGNIIHELIGIIMLVFLLLHLKINIKWIKMVIGDCNEHEYKNVIVNSALIISCILTIITGIIISQSIFSFLNINYSTVVVEIHKYSSYVMIGCFIVHVIFHLNVLSLYISNLFHLENKKNIEYSIMALLFIIFIIMIKENFFKSISKKEEIINQINDNSDDKSYEEDSSDTPPTLNEYLSTRHCGGCHNRCVLTSFRCNRGTEYYEEAKEDYYEEYSNSLSYTSDNTLESSDGEYKITL